MERLGEADAVRAVEHAADHQRRRAEVARKAQLRIALRQAGVDRRTAPQDLHLRDVVPVDLIERRVLGAGGVAVVAAPLAVRRAALRADRDQDG
jgi:hypothetical protein